MVDCKQGAASSGLEASRRLRVLGGVLAIVLGLCLISGRPGAALAQTTAADCEMTVEQTWLGDLAASAIARGECSLATLDLVVRNGVDEVVWSASYQSGDLMGFDGIAEPEALRIAIEDWLGTYADNSRSGALPEWPQGADQPDAGEFPFYVEDGLSQQDYEDLRAGDYPMICYIQGRESTVCLVRHPGFSALISVGAQSFPG